MIEHTIQYHWEDIVYKFASLLIGNKSSLPCAINYYTIFTIRYLCVVILLFCVVALLFSYTFCWQLLWPYLLSDDCDRSIDHVSFYSSIYFLCCYWWIHIPCHFSSKWWGISLFRTRLHWYSFLVDLFNLCSQ